MYILYLAQLVVLSVQDHGSVQSHIVKALGFGLEYAVAVPKELRMAFPYICDHHDVRLSCLGKPGHLTKMTDAHLEDSDLVFFGHTEDREGESYIIVKIPLRLQHPEALRQNGSDHFLCAGLAHGAGDPDYLRAERAAVEAGDLLNGFIIFFCQDVRAVRHTFRMFGERHQSASLHYLRDKGMSVHFFPFEGHKQESFPDLSAVNLHSGHFAVEQFFRPVIAASACTGNIAYRQILHEIVS